MNRKKLFLASFTEEGGALGESLAERLCREGFEAEHACLRRGGRPLPDWVREHFRPGQGLVFIGAAGIAVRAVAPFVKSKAADPAVVVLDERGRFVIPLLSGHLGGANDLARRLAELTGGQAALTTATDVRGVFAVDSWAVEQGLAVANPEQIKGVSAALLAGEEVCVRSDLPVGGQPPTGVVLNGAGSPAVYIGWRAQAPPSALHLVPPALTAGVGCRRGVPAGRIGQALDAALAAAGAHPGAVGKVCSIDLKADEPGLLEFCRARGLPLVTYSAGQLAGAPGEFTASPFVREVTGVGNVCERAAALGAGEGGSPVLGKQAGDGVTIALAAGRYRLSFPGEPEQSEGMEAE